MRNSFLSMCVFVDICIVLNEREVWLDEQMVDIVIVGFYMYILIRNDKTSTEWTVHDFVSWLYASLYCLK